MRHIFSTFLLCIALAGLKAQSLPLSTIGETGELYSELLQATRKYYVQLPEGYDTANHKRYPVVYLLDGEVHLPALYAVHQYYSGGFMPEMILVGLDNSQNRTRDLTTSSVDMLYGQPAKDDTGKASEYLKFLKTELIPHIESRYLTTDYRTLIGHSYGGLFSLYTFLESPDTFANYLAIDPSLDWDDQSLFKSAEDSFGQRTFDHKSLFISLNGQLHMQDPAVTIENVMEDESFSTQFARANIAFSKLIKSRPDNGLKFEWKFYPRDLHGTIPLPSLLDGLISVFHWFQMEDTHKFNNYDTPVATLAEVIQHRAEKLEKHFGYGVPPYPEDLVNAMSYLSMDMGQFNKAKMFLDHYLQFYPESANAYDSMADYYERQNQAAEALKYAQKALEISGSNYHKQKVVRLKKL